MLRQAIHCFKILSKKKVDFFKNRKFDSHDFCDNNFKMRLDFIIHFLFSILIFSDAFFQLIFWFFSLFSLIFLGLQRWRLTYFKSRIKKRIILFELISIDSSTEMIFFRTINSINRWSIDEFSLSTFFSSKRLLI